MKLPEQNFGGKKICTQRTKEKSYERNHIIIFAVSDNYNPEP